MWNNWCYGVTITITLITVWYFNSDKEAYVKNIYCWNLKNLISTLIIDQELQVAIITYMNRFDKWCIVCGVATIVVCVRHVPVHRAFGNSTGPPISPSFHQLYHN